MYKDWYVDGDKKGYERIRDAIGTLASWYRKGNLALRRGSGRNVEEIFGLPYTSSSDDCAGIWNCNGAVATYKAIPNAYFKGVVLSDEGKFMAMFVVLDEGYEADYIYIEMN